MRQRHNNRQNNGFTLLEILIALFIFTIIAFIMTRALHNALDIQAQTEKQAQAFSQLQSALLIFSRDSEQIINRPIINFQSKIETAVLGTPTEISFTHAGLANPNGNLLRSTLQRVRYRVVKNNLVRETWEALDQTAKSKFQTRVLLNNVKSIHFDYLNQKKLFTAHWPDVNGAQQSPLPKAIRFTLVLQNKGKIEQTYLIPDQTNDRK